MVGCYCVNMEHKGAADVDSIETNDFEAGDCLTLEVGDWNGSGFSYKMNSNAKITVYVVETFDNSMTVVPRDDRNDWSMTGNTELEVEVDSDGFTDLVGSNSWNDRVKSVEHHEGLSGYHKVQFGIEKTRNQ